MNPYIGDRVLDPPDEDSEPEFEDDDADFFEPNEYEDEFLDPNAP